MPRTKIVCTLGPASNKASILRSMIRAGMNVARLNFSHGTQAEHRATIRKIRRIASEEDRPIAVLADMGGPKFRLGKVKTGETLREGRRVSLMGQARLGTSDRLSTNRPTLLPQLGLGDRVMIWDGKVQLEVIETGEEEVTCRVVIGGPLKDGAGLNMPDTTLDIPALTDKDKKDIAFCARQGVDFIALSFVRTAADIELCRREIRSNKVDIPIVAKMEKTEAIRNLEEIIEATDGVMVARGDLGIEIPLEEVPRAQKRIIACANTLGKPVITATEMLLSMVDAARPTRAEAGDVANAILDGSDAVMLSEETSVGKHPSEVIRMMARIAEATEKGAADSFNEARRHRSADGDSDLGHAIARSTVDLARDLNAAVIITPTDSGDTPRRLVLQRPPQAVIALSTSDRTLRRLALSWGVVPWKLPRRLPLEKILPAIRDRILDEQLGVQGDHVIFCAGYPFGAKENSGRVIQTEVI
ncbi:MAG: pyruvate kinase [Nitrospinota bacterium]